MEQYKTAVSQYVFHETIEWSPMTWSNAKKELDEWTTARNKHSVINYFDNQINRVYYTKQLFGCRVDCFHKILNETHSRRSIRSIIQNKSSIVSFGCGPGPEIAAYIDYVRNVLKCKNHIINIEAVDCLPGWKPFIEAAKGADVNTTIGFQAGRLSNSYLLRMKASDICIMSYPHAMNFEDIWKNLKEKFSLIIFIDQAKGPLLRKAKLHGFKFVNFKFKGDKTFFYYINDEYDNEDEESEDENNEEDEDDDDNSDVEYSDVCYDDCNDDEDDDEDDYCNYFNNEDDSNDSENESDY